MSAVFLLPVCLTYWPRKYTTRANPHVDNSHQVCSWYDHPLPSYSVFLSAGTSRDLVTLNFELLTLNSCRTWRVTWSTLPPSLKTLRPLVHDLRIITVPIDSCWKCVRGHCACAESRDPWVGGQKQLHFCMFDPDLPIHYATLVALRWKWLKLSAKIMQRMSFCACAKSRDLLKVP